MKPREIILLALLIAGGILLTQERTGKVWPDWRAGDFFLFDGRSFSFQESRTLEPPLPAALKLVNAHGEVTVEGAETDRITLTLEKVIRRRSESEAKAVADGLHATVVADSRTVTVGTNRDDFRTRHFDTHFRLTVPLSLTLEVENSYGTVKVRGVAGAAIINRHGEVEASNIAGALKVENGYENVTVDGVRGVCDIRSVHSDVLARRVEGGLILDHAYGSITLQKIHFKSQVQEPHAEVPSEDTARPVAVRNSYEDITLRRVGAAKVTGRHSDIEVAEVDGDLEAAVEYASVAVSSVRGNLRVTGKSVALSASDVSGGEIYISTSYEPVKISGFSGKTTILVSHGDVTLAPLPLTGPIEVRGDYSGITLRLPAGGPYPLEARTRSGDIAWHLSEPVQVEDKEGVREVRAFTSVTDKPGIRLLTTYDDIDLEGVI